MDLDKNEKVVFYSKIDIYLPFPFHLENIFYIQKLQFRTILFPYKLCFTDRGGGGRPGQPLLPECGRLVNQIQTRGQIVPIILLPPPSGVKKLSTLLWEENKFQRFCCQYPLIMYRALILNDFVHDIFLFSILT